MSAPDFTMDDVVAQLKAAMRVDDGPPPGVPHWTLEELAAIFGKSRAWAADHARAAVERGEMGRAWAGKGYVYWMVSHGK